MLKPGEEDRNLVRLHVRMLGDKLILPVESIQIQKMMLLTQHFAALVQLADRDSDIVEFSIIGKVDKFLILKVDVIDMAKGGQESENDGCGGRKASNREGSFDDSAEADLEPMLPRKGKGRSAKVVRPVSDLFRRNAPDMPLRPLRELDGSEFDDAILLRCVGDMDALIDGKAGNFSEIMVGMGPYRADSIGTEGHSLIIPSVDFIKAIFAAHGIYFKGFFSEVYQSMKWPIPSWRSTWGR